MSGFPQAVAGVRGEKTADCRAAALAAPLIRALGNNFPPRAPWSRKLLDHFRLVVSDAVQPLSGGLAWLLLDPRWRWDTGK